MHTISFVLAMLAAGQAAVTPPAAPPPTPPVNSSFILQTGTLIAGQAKDAHGKLWDLNLTLTNDDTRRFLLDRADFEMLDLARHDLANCQVDLAKTAPPKPSFWDALAWPMVGVAAVVMFAGGVYVGVRVTR